MDTGRILEITFVSVILYLVLKNADQFGSAIRAIGDVYSKGVTTLQGR